MTYTMFTITIVMAARFAVVSLAMDCLKKNVLIRNWFEKAFFKVDDEVITDLVFVLDFAVVYIVATFCLMLAL